MLLSASVVFSGAPTLHDGSEGRTGRAASSRLLRDKQVDLAAPHNTIIIITRTKLIISYAVIVGSIIITVVAVVVD